MNLRMWIRLLYARRKFKGKCYYLSGSENLLAPLSTEEEEYWVKKYDEENSLEARNKLIEHNMRLVIYVAKKYETEYATLEDLASNEDSITDKIEKDYEKEILYEAIEDLNDREKTIIYMRYGLNGYEEQTQKETAEILGISQSYISRLEKRILKKMRLKFQV